MNKDIGDEMVVESYSLKLKNKLKVSYRFGVLFGNIFTLVGLFILKWLSSL